jgi:hypothetical protein
MCLHNERGSFIGRPTDFLHRDSTRALGGLQQVWQTLLLWGKRGSTTAHEPHSVG